MALLYVGSVASHSGKNVVCLGLGHQLLKDGKKLAYIKPYGASPAMAEGTAIDAEAWMIAQSLGLEQTPGQTSPVVANQDLRALALRHQCADLILRIKKSVEELSPGKDLTLLSGAGTLASGAMCGVDAFAVTAALDTKLILVDRYENQYYLDNLVRAADVFGDRLVGVIINNTNPEMNDALQNEVIPYLAGEKITVLGCLPKDELLRAVSVQNLVQMLGASLLTGARYGSRLVKRFFIGAMQVTHAGKFFSGSRDFACLVGGDRPDIQMAAIESHAACLILTGNFYPSDIILSRAEENKVPVLVVRADTYSAAHRVESMRHRISLQDEEKIGRAEQLVRDNVDFKALYQKLGL
ncbi:MAG: phosphotransacetylase family protein [Deltaproteobacteria bacterium]|nr:phosphotransacetylase family protein [Deltaproteobacteria bacterium]